MDNTMTEFKIERVRMPRKDKYPFSTMKAGKSFWRSEDLLGHHDKIHQCKTALAMRKYASKSGKEFSSKVEYDEKGTKGMRFYRIS